MKQLITNDQTMTSRKPGDDVKLEIKTIFGKLLYSSESRSIKKCAEDAVKEKAYLTEADLTGADLRGADLRGADIRGAYLTEADLTGAYLTGDIKIQKQPIQLDALQYYIFIFDNHMKIGCEFHLITEWFNFDDKRILEMDGKSALKFWRKWKFPLQAICQAESRGQQ